MNLIIDVGNTRIKTAVFDRSEIIHVENISIDNFSEKIIELAYSFTCKNAIMSSVAIISKEEINKVKEKINLLELNQCTKVPFINNYESKETLGVDRIALASAAVTSFPQKNVLVIDSGTCITYDFVNKKGEYLGGAISPGILMRYKALNKFTGKLPLLSPKLIENFIGNTTENSIHIGINQGVINEIDSFIDLYRKKNTDLTVVLTGGDVYFLSNKFKNSIFANPNFLLEGLNRILTYNIS